MLVSLMVAVMLSAQAPGAETPPVVAPADSTTTTTTTQPAVVASPPPAPTAGPAPDQKPTGLDTVPTAAAQMGAGVAGCCVGACIGAPCALIPFAGGFLSSIIVGTAIGATETVVGDAVGQKRAAMLWPVLSSAGILLVGQAASVGVLLALTGTAALDPTQLTGALGVPQIASAAVSLTALVAALVVPAVIYQFTGVEKEAGDRGGFGMPGITEPADPTGTRTQKKAASSPSSSSPPPAVITPAPAY